MIRVLVLHRDRAVGEGIAAGLAGADGIEPVGAVQTCDQVSERLAQPGAGVDMVVASARSDAGELLSLARELRAAPGGAALVITGLPPSDSVVLEYVEAGIDAFLTEDLTLSGLLIVLRLLHRGEVLVTPPVAHLLIRRLHAMASLLADSGADISAVGRLTPKQLRVLELLGEGLSNAAIARSLFIEVGTVKSHVHAILRKMQVRTRDEARKLWILARSKEGGTPA